MVEGTGGKERILGFRRSSICSEESSSYCFRFLTTVDYQFSVGASRRFSKGIVGIRISVFQKSLVGALSAVPQQRSLSKCRC